MKELKIKNMHHSPEIHVGNCTWMSYYPTQLLGNISAVCSFIRSLIMQKVLHCGAGKECEVGDSQRLNEF